MSHLFLLAISIQRRQAPVRCKFNCGLKELVVSVKKRGVIVFGRGAPLDR
jgi:hypothetical protein